MADDAPAPGEGLTRIADGELQEWDGERWVPFSFLPTAGSGGDGKPVVIYKIIGNGRADR
jgi:hypothetical protein